MRCGDTKRVGIGALLTALSILATLVVTAADAGAPSFGVLTFDCDTFGGNCSSLIPDIEEGMPGVVESQITVPDEACLAALRVSAAMQIDHQWVGDLQVSLRREGSSRTAVLVNRPGAPARGPFGCPGVGIDVRVDDGVEGLNPVGRNCSLTIPAIDGVQASAPQGTHLSIQPGDPPLFDGCPFEDFQGDLIDAGGSTLLGSACPPLTTDGIQCDFRGPFNDECGDDVTVRLTTNDGTVRMQILEEAPAQFLGTVEGPFVAALTVFEIIASREESGPVELSGTGLQEMSRLACGGTWILRVEDHAAPHRGRLLGWTLFLGEENTPTPTHTATNPPTATSTATSTKPPTDTPTATPTAPSDTPTEAPTDTPSTPTNTDTPTTAPTTPGGSTPTPQPPTDTPTGSPTDTPTTPTTGSPTATPTGTAVTATPTGSMAPTEPTQGIPCVGDCDGSGEVSISELIRGVNIALGTADLALCEAFDRDGNGSVEISELIAAVNNALNGCP